MPIDTRRCFWFGTEERAGFFATPLKGADSSPSAWGVDGTLLNGGGYGFNSVGSHKRYTYEWPQSSSPETAQMMKSYRDGTYGRGLLYFLEPGIYRTNILPAHWADPSMSINNEAPSLVYGLDPVGVPTSGGSDLNLPIVSAQYDLSATPAQTAPTPDSSVFLPIPTGHTLFLGAFYYATGSGGVYATPINSNGTLGNTVKLTEKPNSDTDVVTDRFEGDIRGVRLWVGRLTSDPSTVTLAAMAGRLMETADTVTYGPWSETARNRAFAPIASSNWLAQGGTGGAFTSSITPNGVEGAPVMEITWTSAPTSGNTRIYTAATNALRSAVTPLVPIPWAVDVSATGPTVAVSVDYYTEAGGFVSNVTLASFQAVSTDPANPTRLSGTMTPPGTATRAILVILAPLAGIVAGSKLGASRIALGTPTYFDGSSNPSGELARTRWDSGVNTSASIKETRPQFGSAAKQGKLVAGPWIGGQGHSGCRFVGTPSYVNNGPVEGGRVGFAASFVEVGSWVYG